MSISMELEDVKKRNRLLELQLKQVEAELNFYFKECKLLEEKLLTNSSHATESDTKVSKVLPQNDRSATKRSNTNAVTVLDFKKYLRGDGWYNAENFGRWAGPETHSTLYLAPLPEGRYRLEMTLIDSMSMHIVKKTQLQFDGKLLEPKLQLYSHMRGITAPLRRIKAAVTDYEKPFPATLTYEVIIKSTKPMAEDHKIDIITPNVESPASKGQNDYRDLSICVEKIEVTKLG